MRALRLIRGVVGTAITWAVPWAILGGSLAAVVEAAVVTQADVLYGASAVWFVAMSGARLFGFLGAASGAAFAIGLAASGRRMDFAHLTSQRMLVLGGAGGAAIAGAFFGLAALTTTGWSASFVVAVVVAAALGSGSAWATWRLASRVPRGSTPQNLSAGDRWSTEKREQSDRVRRATT